MTQKAPFTSSGTEKPVDVHATVSQPTTSDVEDVAEPTQPTKGFRFWVVIAALAAGKLMLSIETTIVSTAMPTIASALNMGGEYVWASNGAALASAAIAPPMGQLADLFGRRIPTVLSFLIFVAGGILSGAAESPAHLIAGRIIQGLGSGGINVMAAIVVSDLVPVRSRGMYMAIILAAYLLGATSGPLLGGVLAQAGIWRWVFWLPVPFGVVGMVLLAFCLKGGVRDADVGWREKLKRVDYAGNTILTAATASMLYAVTYAGAERPWSDARIIGPLVAGVVGLGLFVLLQHRLAGSETVQPVMPLRLVTHRAGATLAIGAFISSLLSGWVNFLLPVYFQGVLASTPSRAGVQMLPVVTVAVPASICAVVLVSRVGRYKLLHVAGFAAICVAVGLFSILKSTSGDGEWVGYEVIFSLGLGLVINTLLPAFQGAVAEDDQAMATSAFTFVQSLALIWSVTVPAAVFNGRFDALSGSITNQEVRSQLGGGRAYGSATRAFLTQLDDRTRAEVVGVFQAAITWVWYVAIAVAGFGVLMACAEKEIVLREKLETDFALEQVNVTKEEHRIGK
ncbi:hypothetical protein MCOR25_008566 [Pyricularia grisea]|uniref:Major facilitator superfamily (MFS) profile domain-containing protein n=1 Tax=Pyricularia grisea TaxID=148305 RepID=A0A6P8AUM3_PYRGI|nr:uncharacterized protein PgNI_08280 [Pyricularia grisea]KAI6354539.1 hypothetical protein MCOR25_008566 [Pyricularia grisea]TLD05923.1 hypothetical protein PgNI_08280 [Pyricularia grisea]